MADRFSERMLGDVVHRVWDLRVAGLTERQIGAEVGWSHVSVARLIKGNGGVRPRWGRDLQGRSLSFLERQEIMVLRAEGLGVRAIGRTLGRAPSTISRELKRNADRRGDYRATGAQAQAHSLSKRPKAAKLQDASPLRLRVQRDLLAKLSPEQISGRLRNEFPDRPEMQVSHETIYQAVYLLARGGLRRDLESQLRTGRYARKPQRVAGQRGKRGGKIPDMIMIVDRPPEALDRAVPGHWEGDLIVGKESKTAIGTIVERRSGHLMLLHLDPTRSRVETVRDALIKKMGDLPDHLRRTLTWDQGVELHRHKDIHIAADIDIYFCDPHSPWQRPTNENTNGLLRQYFPKGTDLSIYGPEDLDYVAWEMNERPRKRLQFKTPNEMMAELLLR